MSRMITSCQECLEPIESDEQVWTDDGGIDHYYHAECVTPFSEGVDIERKTTPLEAWVLGVKEARSDLTTHFDDYELLEAYDEGRDWQRKNLGMED